MEDFVTYEQAKFLKELGFDWKCTHYYDDKGTLTPSFEEVSADGGYEYTISINNLVGNFNLQNGEDDEWCSAPTLSQVQKWLREVKQIDLFVTKELSKYYWYIGKEFQIGNCDTYEEALSKGIDITLKNLK